MKQLRNIAFVLGVAAFMGSCSSSPSEDPGNVTVDGNDVDFGTQANLGWSASIGDNYTVEYGAGYVSGQKTLDVSLGDHVYPSYDQANFFAFFTNGSKTFAVDDTVPGASISYQETSSGDSYSSRYGSQTGSSITFSNFTPKPGTGFIADRVEFTVTFNCKLYNYNNPSDMKTISGTLDGHFEKY
jgi:hypothetical protein